MSNSAADQLKKARQSRNLSIEEIAGEMNIQPQYLEAIEKGDFSALPDLMFAQEFIRTYANYLGVDPNPVLHEYRNFRNPVEKTPQENVSPIALSRRERHAQNRSQRQFRIPLPPKKWLVWGGGIVCLLLVTFITWLFLDQEEPAAQTVESKPPASSPSPAPQIQSRPTVSLLQPSETYKYGDVYGIKNADRVELKLTAVKPTEIRVRADGPTGKILAEKKLTPGKTETFTHEKWISLRVDHPNYVNLFVNGVKIDTAEQKEVHIYQLKLTD
ncbi:RodZ domain-containing protein [Lihuaxuella thermophila]|uniref:Helix-turn-helix domain-containing protein n=1 Tax=Lihuaxuella thermophila TaxID=1173111 RepID=A0A1H8GJI8_9BACL|nr:RodZ domain-containing protein [Lihuaxuella thermophila]SEN43914.1 Helix-turn-helix domain-containing protein [Lihuaxuella thermophila]